MAKKITIVNPALSSENRAKINETAEKYGYFTEFFQSNQEALPHLQETEIIFGMGADLIKAAPQLRWFCSHTAGVDNYMEPGLFRDDSVLLSNSSGAYGVTLAEHTVMVTLMLLRRELEYSHIVEERKWIKNLSFRSLYGSRISILGTGDLGRTIASRFQGFHPARILGFNHSGRKSSDVFTESLPIAQLDSYLPKTDILISCLPGTKETYLLLGKEKIEKLPTDAYLVNVGRGNVVDGHALAEILRSGKLAGAALDVFETEPLPADSELWSCPHLLITPHIAGNMTLGYTVDKATDLFCEDLENYCNGRPLLRLVDRKKGY